MINNLRLKLKEQKGFTLIELLAVIVILGIIAAIAIPAIGNVIEKSKNNAIVAEAISIIDAARLAQVDGEVGTKASNGLTYSWASTATTANPPVVSSQLEKYLSKVKDNAWTVVYTPLTNKYTITGHDVAKVLDPTAGSDADIITEEKLAAEASN